MRKLTLIVHTSLDGFVAGLKGELDGFDASEENLKFVGKLTDGADAALFGRISYQLLDGYWPTASTRPKATRGEITYSKWYNKAQKIIISKTLPKANMTKTIVISKDIVSEIKKIKKQKGKDILIFGSPSVSQILMKADLIDSYWVFFNPIIFGNGIPLFKSMKHNIKLKLVATKLFSNGEIGVNYLVKDKLELFTYSILQ